MANDCIDNYANIFGLHVKCKNEWRYFFAEDNNRTRIMRKDTDFKYTDSNKN